MGEACSVETPRGEVARPDVAMREDIRDATAAKAAYIQARWRLVILDSAKPTCCGMAFVETESGKRTKTCTNCPKERLKRW